MSRRILTWRAGEECVAVTRRAIVVNITEDGNEPTLIGKPRGPETPMCERCGTDARLPCTLHRFTERRGRHTIASGWRCA